MSADEMEREERRLKTYHGQAQHNDDDLVGGRFAKVMKTAHVTGSAPTVAYPQLPAGSPWSGDGGVGPEPLIDGTGDGVTLGYRIDGGPEPPAEGAGAVVVKRKSWRKL